MPLNIHLVFSEPPATLLISPPAAGATIFIRALSHACPLPLNLPQWNICNIDTEHTSELKGLGWFYTYNVLHKLNYNH